MILHPADDERLAIEIREDAAEVAVEFITQRLVFQKWPPFLGREDQVQKDLCERLRHGVSVWVSADEFNPFRVDACGWPRFQGSPQRATLGWMIESRWDSLPQTP